MGLFVTYMLRKLFENKIKRVEEQIDYKKIHHGPYNFDNIVKFILNLFSMLLVVVLFSISLYNINYVATVAILSLFGLYLMTISFYVHRVCISCKT